MRGNVREMENFFIADTHFGHVNMLKFEPEHRPYADIYEHDKAIVEAWNYVVGKKDRIWVLGDFAWGKGNLIRIAGYGGLNGDKRLVLGNHDKIDIMEYVKFGFRKIYGVAYFENKFVLSHCPLHMVDNGRWSHNIHGHRHSKPSPTKQHFGVSVEQAVMRFGIPRPFHWDDILRGLHNDL